MIIVLIMLTVMITMLIMMTILHLVSVSFERMDVVLDPLQSHCLFNQHCRLWTGMMMVNLMMRRLMMLMVMLVMMIMETWS